MLRARNFLAQPSQQPAHIAHSQTVFAQHILPRPRTSPPLRASPSPGPCPPSPARGSAPPPLSRRPAMPINMCATGSADSTCAQAASTIVVRRPRRYSPGQPHPTRWRPHVHAQRTGARAFLCRGVRMHAHTSHGLWQQSYSRPVLACSGVGSVALQAHMYCRHTCIAAHLGQMQCCCGFVLSPARAGLGCPSTEIRIARSALIDFFFGFVTKAPLSRSMAAGRG